MQKYIIEYNLNGIQQGECRNLILIKVALNQHKIQSIKIFNSVNVTPTNISQPAKHPSHPPEYRSPIQPTQQPHISFINTPIYKSLNLSQINIISQIPPPTMVPEKQLVTYTALSIVAEEDLALIQQIRQKHDPAFDRWPPHINIAFPFVEPARFDQVEKILGEEFKEFKAFQIGFKNVSSFPHGVCFVDPETDGNQLQEIYNRAVARLPEIASKKHENFTPHMTIANKIKKQAVDALRQQLQAQWKEWKWTCKGLHILQREKDTPFRTAKFIPFKN